ncbi:MAG: hypothetical protein M1827_004200 [Pycnora praestabilis]|nr:MAG: hypothetical protein M1827_004200 [Pycnora praestabilis]
MEEIQVRHRKEQRDLQSRVTQKKKSATKKTRKGVNDECTELERQLKERQDQELVSLSISSVPNGLGEQSHELVEDPSLEETSDLSEDVQINGAEKGTTQSAITPEDQYSAQQRKPNRQKARLARRAAEQGVAAAQAASEAAELPNLREQERAVMAKEFSKYGLREKEIRPDGHCLYSAVADQLVELGIGLAPKIESLVISSSEVEERKDDPGYRIVRRAAAGYIATSPDDFLPFLEEPLEEYTHKIRDTAEWGGQLELLALAKAYAIKINVLQGDGRVERIEPGSEVGEEQIWLGYYRHHFGLGEHYNSLRKAF